MKKLFLLSFLFATQAYSQSSEIKVHGLMETVEVYRDANGVNHIYAKNEHDLFFAQGYCAAQDRLFQFELWRRQATGTMAQIFGEREIKRDIGARLFKFRSDLKTELNHYHPRGESIIQAFTDGINAYIGETERKPDLLPLEFSLLGIKPGRWTPEVVISRHQGLLNNLTDELAVARAVATLGESKVKRLMNFEPGEPDITIHPSINKSVLFENIIEPYEAFRKPLSFTPQDVKLSGNLNWKEFQTLASADEQVWQNFYAQDRTAIGSNNWVVSGKKSASGLPMLANDPHRAITVPSLRYIVHLNAPGWNVIGGGEPTIPGVSIGHNDDGAWGLTVFQIDAEDLYVYELNPDNPRQYRYKDKWAKIFYLLDTIHVKGSPDVVVEHLFTRHGPVTYLDPKTNTAVAVQCGWLDIGASPYLASLRMNQAKNVNEFMEACTYSRLPAENMIWADRAGNIAWQAVGVAPVRKNWSGLVPVPANGSFEWDDYLPIKNLPHLVNPVNGYVATANENNVPPGYEHRQAVGWQWAEPFRANRIHEVLNKPKLFTQQELMKLQFDYLSLPARELVPFLRKISSKNPLAEKARLLVVDSNWNFELTKESVAATVYVTWEKHIMSHLHNLLVPEAGKKYIKSLSLNKVIGWLKNPPPELGSEDARDVLLIRALEDAVEEIRLRLGDDMTAWQYGQEKNHHVLIKHPLSNALNAEMRKKLEVGPAARGGNSYTPGMTTNSLNQLTGASFRMVVDTKDWDACMFTNSPGQSGDPNSPYYKNLFNDWANDKHFNVVFSKAKVRQRAKQVTLLQRP